MFILGLTGPLASGKTTVSKMFKEAGASVLSADKLVHELQQSHYPYAASIAAHTKKDVLDEQGNIDRTKLGEALIKNPESLKIVEDILHPPLRSLIKERISHITSEKHDFLIVLEVPLMFKSGMNELCDKVASCICLDETRHQRALERSSMSEEKWQFLNSKQRSNVEFQELADCLINTDGSMEETSKKVTKIIQKVQTLPAHAWEEKWQKIPG